MRILLVNKYFYRKGGAETYFFALAEGLRALGHEVAFFSMQHPNNESSYWSKLLITPLSASIIHCQIVPEIIGGSSHGTRNAPRKAAESLKF